GGEVAVPSSPSFAYAGTHSPRLKAARRLAKRAFRDRDRAFLAEGPQAVAEAFSYGARISDLFVTAAARTRPPERREAIAPGRPQTTVAQPLEEDHSGPSRRASASFASPGRGGPAGASRPGESVTASNHRMAGGLGGVVSTPQKTQVHLVND